VLLASEKVAPLLHYESSVKYLAVKKRKTVELECFEATGSHPPCACKLLSWNN